MMFNKKEKFKQMSIQESVHPQKHVKSYEISSQIKNCKFSFKGFPSANVIT